MVAKETAGGLKGYSVGNLSLTRKVPFCVFLLVGDVVLLFVISARIGERVWTYVERRVLRSLHVDFPVIQICFVCQFDFDAFRRGFDELR